MIRLRNLEAKDVPFMLEWMRKKMLWMSQDDAEETCRTSAENQRNKENECSEIH